MQESKHVTTGEDIKYRLVLLALCGVVESTSPITERKFNSLAAGNQIDKLDDKGAYSCYSYHGESVEEEEGVVHLFFKRSK